MNSLLNIADKVTKHGTVALLVLFAVACLFSGCKVNGDFPEATTATQTIITRKPSTTAPITTEATTKMTCLTSQISLLDMGEFKLTAYCNCKKCCGKWADGKTATGTVPKQGRTIAVDQDVIPYGYEVIIDGHTYVAEDCGGAIIGRHIDIYFDSHEEAEEFGVQYADVLMKVNQA